MLESGRRGAACQARAGAGGGGQGPGRGPGPAELESTAPPGFTGLPSSASAVGDIEGSAGSVVGGLQRSPPCGRALKSKRALDELAGQGTAVPPWKARGGRPGCGTSTSGAAPERHRGCPPPAPARPARAPAPDPPRLPSRARARAPLGQAETRPCRPSRSVSRRTLVHLEARAIQPSDPGARPVGSRSNDREESAGPTIVARPPPAPGRPYSAGPDCPAARPLYRRSGMTLFWPGRHTKHGLPSDVRLHDAGFYQAWLSSPGLVVLTGGVRGFRADRAGRVRALWTSALARPMRVRWEVGFIRACSLRPARVAITLADAASRSLER